METRQEREGGYRGVAVVIGPRRKSIVSVFRGSTFCPHHGINERPRQRGAKCGFNHDAYFIKAPIGFVCRTSVAGRSEDLWVCADGGMRVSYRGLIIGQSEGDSHVSIWMRDLAVQYKCIDNGQWWLESLSCTAPKFADSTRSPSR